MFRCILLGLLLAARNVSSIRVINMMANKAITDQIKKPLLGFLTATALFFNSGLPAYAGALENANQVLSDYDLPPMLYVPSGFTPLVSEFGRGNVKKGLETANPIIVQFSHPQFWVVQKTAVNKNGESGTVGANDYGKGDSSFLFVSPLENGEKADLANKKVVEKILLKSLSQKGDPVESFKIYSILPGAAGSDGQKYFISKFGYELNTEAGFLVARKGVVSMTNVGPNVQSLVALTTGQRFKNMGSTLDDIASSFRVYKLNSGVFSGAGTEKQAAPAAAAAEVTATP